MKRIKPDPAAVGERIREIRSKLGLSMEEFAKRIDSKARSGTVSNWETGKNLPNNQRLKRIAEIGGVSNDFLMYGSTLEFVLYNLPAFLDESKQYLSKVIQAKFLIDIAKRIEDKKIPLGSYNEIKNIIDERIPIVEIAFKSTTDEYVEVAYKSKSYMEKILKFLRETYNQPQYKDKETFLSFLKEFENSSLEFRAEHLNILEGYIDNISTIEKGGYLTDDFAFKVELNEFIKMTENNEFTPQFIDKHYVIYRVSPELPKHEKSFLIPSDDNSKIYLIPQFERAVERSSLINRKCFVVINRKSYIGKLDSHTKLIFEETKQLLDIKECTFISPILIEIY